MASVLERLDVWGCKAFQTDEEWGELRQAIKDGERVQSLQVELDAGREALVAEIERSIKAESAVKRLTVLLRRVQEADWYPGPVDLPEGLARDIDAEIGAYHPSMGKHDVS